MVSAGIICSKQGFGCTVLSDSIEAEHHAINVPANLSDRGEQLCWLADEITRLVTSSTCAVAAVQKASTGGKYGASPDRIEVEAAVQMGLHRAGVETLRLTKEGVRAALNVPKGRNAYESLLQRSDVKAQRNDSCRHQYVLALAARS